MNPSCGPFSGLNIVSKGILAMILLPATGFLAGCYTYVPCRVTVLDKSSHTPVSGASVRATYFALIPDLLFYPHARESTTGPDGTAVVQLATSYRNMLAMPGGPETREGLTLPTITVTRDPYLGDRSPFISLEISDDTLRNIEKKTPRDRFVEVIAEVDTEPVYQREGSASPISKYSLWVSQEQPHAFSKELFWRIKICSRDGTLLYEDKTREFDAASNAAWAWDKDSRVWFYHNGGGKVYYWEPVGAKWNRSYWGRAKLNGDSVERVFGMRCTPPSVLFPEYSAETTKVDAHLELGEFKLETQHRAEDVGDPKHHALLP